MWPLTPNLMCTNQTYERRERESESSFKRADVCSPSASLLSMFETCERVSLHFIAPILHFLSRYLSLSSTVYLGLLSSRPALQQNKNGNVCLISSMFCLTPEWLFYFDEQPALIKPNDRSLTSTGGKRSSLFLLQFLVSRSQIWILLTGVC